MATHRTAGERGWATVQDELAAIERSATEIRYLLPTMITGRAQFDYFSSCALDGEVAREFISGIADEFRHEQS